MGNGWNLALVLFCLIGLAARTVPGETRYVNGRAAPGRDSGSGTFTDPFHSIRQASAVLRPGDTCLIRAGVYRETIAPKASGTSIAPILYAPYPGERVRIDGTDSARGKWIHMGKNLFSLKLPASAPGAEIHQVFLDGSPMAENTWPKMQAGFSVAQYRLIERAIKISPSRWCLEDSAIPMIGKDGYWSGASLWLLLGVKTSAHILPLFEHKNNRICFNHWSDRAAYFPSQEDGRASYFAIIKRPSDISLLEPGQWAFDAGQRKLYIRFAKGDSPARRRIEYRSRLSGLDLRREPSLKHIQARGLEFFAASVDFGEAESSSVADVRVRYAAPFFHKPPPLDKIMRTINMTDQRWRGVHLSGSGNVFRNSQVDGSWADGISVTGLRNAAMVNTVVNTNWIAGDFGAVSVVGKGHRILRNSIRGTGRSGIVHVAAAACDISYNRIEDFGRIADDFGGTYTVGTDGEGTVISNNRIGPAANQAGKYPTQPENLAARMAGIYIDDEDANFRIRGNSVHTGQSGYSLRLNGTQSNIDIYGNFFLDAKGAIATINCGAASMRDVRLEKNRMRSGLKPSDAGCGLEWTKELAAEGNSFDEAEATLLEAAEKAWKENGF